MTASELNATLRMLGWSQRHLARRLDVDKMLVNEWATGKQKVPGQIALWLTRMRKAQADVWMPLKGTWG